MSEEKEEWRQVEGCPDYEVSSLGRVRSKDHYAVAGRGKRFVQGAILRSSWKSSGTAVVAVKSPETGKKTVSVGRLVAKAFLDVPEEGSFRVLHKDGDGRNNRVENLEVRTFDFREPRPEATEFEEPEPEIVTSSKNYFDADDVWRLTFGILRQTAKDLKSRNSDTKTQARNFVYSKWFQVLTSIDRDEFCALANKKGASGSIEEEACASG